MRLLKGLALLAAVSCFAAVKFSCTTGMRADLGIGEHHATFAAATHVGYAAMDEIPVAGGELRLAVPFTMVFEEEQREMIAFPLRHTNIAARLGGMMGVYTVEQTFENPFPNPIEAVYAFPLGAHGAISGYEIQIGERTIKGEIHTTDDANRIYDKARSDGHTAGIVEQIKPNIFTQRVTNIAPGEAVTVRMTYVDTLEYLDGNYQMTMPLTIGPRYKPAIDVPYVAGPRSTSDVSFTAEIDAGMPVVSVASPTHAIESHATGPTKTVVSFAKDGEIPNRDLVVRFSTAGTQTQIGMLAHRTGDTGYFVLTVQPKGTYQTGDIVGREVLVVIDRSGSMQGAPIAQAKAIASGIIGTLGERDRFDIIAFASGVESMSPGPIPGSDGGKKIGLDYLARLQTGGGTEMGAGVAAMLERQPGEDRVRLVYFITDGLIGNDDEVVGAASKLLGTNRIFTIGVSAAPNRSLLDRLAQSGRGFSSYLTPSEDAKRVTEALVARSAYPYLTDIAIDWGGLVSDTQAPTVLPDIYAGQPLVITGRYTKPGSGTVTVRAHAAGRQVTIPISVTLPDRMDFEPVASLWARRQIEGLEERGGYDDQITQLGLQFHLVTAHTAFVAVDRSRVVSNGRPQIVEQPAVVPADMSMPVQEVESTPSRSYSNDDSPSFSGWSSGGPDSSIPWLLFAIVLPAGLGLWVVARRI